MDVLALLLAAIALIAAGVAVLIARQHADEIAEPALLTDVAAGDLLHRIAALESSRSAHAVDSTASMGGAGAGRAAISRIGLVRFDAFDDAGGAQSFAVALLDETGEGIILTSLHSRPTTRLYIKAIRGGAADAPLSEEEEMALTQAGIDRA